MQESETINEIDNKNNTKLSHKVLCGDEKFKIIENYTPLKAIKIMCTECMGFECDPRKECTSKKCPLYPYKGFYRGTLTSKITQKKFYTEEELKKMRANLAKARTKQTSKENEKV